jgi:hypothetical protein
MVHIEDILNRKYLFYSAIFGLLIFGFFQFAKPAYHRILQKTLTKNLQAQIYTLQTLTEDDSDKTKTISEAEKILKKLTKNSSHLSINTITFEKDYILLESLDQYYRYQQEFSELLARVFEYDPENDLNSLSVSESKGNFMYRLSLAQYALKQITIRLKKYDDNPSLADYTKNITSQFPPIIGLIDQLVEATNKGQLETSNQLRLQYINEIKELQAILRPLHNRILQDLSTAIQNLLAQIKI